MLLILQYNYQKTTYDPTTNSNISKPLSETTIISPNKDKANSLSGFITELKNF